MLLVLFRTESAPCPHHPHRHPAQHVAEGRARLESLRTELAAHREEASGLRREVDVAARQADAH